MVASCLPVGADAPAFAWRALDSTALLTGSGRPRVIAFVRTWSADADELAAARGYLRGLAAEMLVLTEAAAYAFAPDDPVRTLPSNAERFAENRATARLLFGVHGDRDAVFVIDATGVVAFSHAPRAPLGDSLLPALAAAGLALTSHRAPPPTFTRREWTTSCLVTGFALALLGCRDRGGDPRDEARGDEAAKTRAPVPADLEVTLAINGQQRTLTIDPRTSLLDALRERLHLTGTKKGCDGGQCGACTVHVGGRRVISCLTLAAMAQGQPIVTIEGLANGDTLHPMQAAFVAHDALQCGFCTPGQIMSAVALSREQPDATDAEIRELMSGNLCRCGAYPNIVAAVKAARRA